MKKGKLAKKKKSDNPPHRPPMYKSPSALQKKIEKYFKNCPDFKTFVSKDGEKYEVPIITISGLVLYLGFADRRSFYEYEEKPDFTHTIKRARTMIEKEYEMLLSQGNVTGAIFALKNFGWIDRSTVENINHEPIKVIVDSESKKKIIDNL